MQAGSNIAPVGQVLWEETVPGGAHWSGVMRRGTALRFTDLEGGANVAALFWNFEEKNERYSMPDTLKAQHTAFLTRGHCGFSDMGRVLFSIVEDTTGGAHDALAGGSTTATNEARYHTTTLRNTRDNFILAAGKLGLDRRDVHPCISFFAPVNVDAEGRFQWDASRMQTGDLIDLRAEMDVLVALSNCPHPLDPSPTYAPGDTEVVRYRKGRVGDDDLCRTASAEAARAFENNAFFLNSSAEA